MPIRPAAIAHDFRLVVGRAFANSVGDPKSMNECVLTVKSPSYCRSDLGASDLGRRRFAPCNQQVVGSIPTPAPAVFGARATCSRPRMLVFRARNGQDHALMPLTEAQRSLIDFEHTGGNFPRARPPRSGPASVSRRAATTARCTHWSIAPMRRRTTRSPCGGSAGGVSAAAVSASRAAVPTLGAGDAPNGADGAE